MRLISWNLLHRDGAQLAEVAGLIERQRPDLLLMQEATLAVEGLPRLIGGTVVRTPLPGRAHGLAMWVPGRFAAPPAVLALPSGSLIRRVCQLVDLGAFSVANVHLSHGQVLNRRQLRTIAAHLPPRAAVVGDYNLVGPPLLPGFRDAGPRRPTHRMSRLLPLRLDRCLVRGLVCTETERLPLGGSDHHPIMLRLHIPSEIGQQQPDPGVT